MGAILRGERRPPNAALAKPTRRVLILLLIPTSGVSVAACSMLSTSEIGLRERITPIRPDGSSGGRVAVPDRYGFHHDMMRS